MCTGAQSLFRPHQHVDIGLAIEQLYGSAESHCMGMGLHVEMHITGGSSKRSLGLARGYCNDLHLCQHERHHPILGSPGHKSCISSIGSLRHSQLVRVLLPNEENV